MSQDLETRHGSVYVGFHGPPHGFPDCQITVGEHEIPLDKFCEMLEHNLTGGMFGWGGYGTPEPIQKLLTRLFEHYAPKGSWVPRQELLQAGE